MNRSPLIFAFTLATAALACSPKKPPAPVEDIAPTATETEPPKPPPPPKCEALDEKCKAKGGKKVKIPLTTLMFEPVTGWTYAQGEKATIAQAGDEDAAMALVSYEVADVKDVKKVELGRQAELDALAAELKITLGKTKVNWKKFQEDKDGKVPLLNWGLPEVTRGTKKGELLIVSSVPSDGRAIFGIAFVPSDDANSSGEKLVGSFHTLAPGEEKEK